VYLRIIEKKELTPYRHQHLTPGRRGLYIGGKGPITLSGTALN
jgi:hypothetical protein